MEFSKFYDFIKLLSTSSETFFLLFLDWYSAEGKI